MARIGEERSGGERQARRGKARPRRERSGTAGVARIGGAWWSEAGKVC